MYTVKKALEAVRTRELLEPYRLSVDKMLRNNGMGEYCTQCKKRCKDYIDNVHIKEDDIGDITVDEDGMFLIADILCSYLSIETVKYYKINLESENELLSKYNMIISAGRKASTAEIKEYIKSVDNEPIGVLFARCEIESRKITNRVYMAFHKLYIKLRYKSVLYMNHVLRFALGLPQKGEIQL